MQKKIIALAIAGLVSGGAFAQSNVTVSGLIRAGVEQFKVSDSGAASYSSQNRVQDQSSMLIFSGKEDLGGGLSAIFQLDQRVGIDDNSTSTALAGGNSHIGLAGNWGTFRLGRSDLHYGSGAAGGVMRAHSLSSILGNGLFSQVNGSAIANTTRTPNVIWYSTPNMSGFTGMLAYSTNWSGVEASGLNNGSANGATNLALNYANGPIAVSYSYWAANQEGSGATQTGANQRSNKLGASYTMPMGLKIGLGWDRSTRTVVAAGVTAPDNTRSAWILPVSYAFGANAVYFQYAKAGNTSNVVGDSGAKAYQIGYDYALSKRTNVGVSYAKVINQTAGMYTFFAAADATSGTAGYDSSQLYMGINHSF